MPLNKFSGTNKNYAIIAEGSIRVKANKGEEGVVERAYENKKTGQSGVKYERSYNSLSGKIENVSFKDSDYGVMLEITIDGVTLSTNTNSKYGSDIMKKLPELDLTQEVMLKPYNFVAEDGKQRTGMTIYQNEKKIPSYFHLTEGKKTTAIHGFPIPQGDTGTYKKNDWTIFYLTIDKFLVDYTEKNIITKFKTEVLEGLKTIEEPEGSEFINEETNEEITAEGLPF